MLLILYFANFLAGSFSAVLKMMFANEYACGSIFQDLQDLRTFASLRTQMFENAQTSRKTFKICLTKCQTFANCSAIFDRFEELKNVPVQISKT